MLLGGMPFISCRAYGGGVDGVAALICFLARGIMPAHTGMEPLRCEESRLDPATQAVQDVLQHITVCTKPCRYTEVTHNRTLNLAT